MGAQGGSAVYESLVEEIERIPTIDAHEHLPTEEVHLQKPADFFSLFEHYCRADLVSAGATEDDLAFLADRDKRLEERWKRFAPLFAAIRAGGYARAALLVIRDILGIPELTEETFEAVGRALKELRKPGLYDAIIRGRCNIEACIQCWRLGEPGPEYFYHLAPSPDLVDLTNRGALDKLARRCKRQVHTLEHALECMSAVVGEWRADRRVVGIKSAHAYGRSIAFQKVERSSAERLFNDIQRSEGHALSAHEALPLQDFLMFELTSRAEAVGLPMVFHTGLQAGNLNRIANANPLLLQPLLEEFPRARIDLFHAGMPYVREIAVLAKYFPGVHLNMAWTHIINPAMARSALEEWLDMVPATKIFGFGGDYAIVEKIYGHLVLARRNIAQVLARKVSEGAVSRTEASWLARRIMHDNPAEFYGIPAR